MIQRFGLIGIASMLLTSVGCSTTAHVQFVRDEVINAYSPREQGLPLELAVVMVTPNDIKRSAALDPNGQLVTSKRWFASYDGDNRCFGVPMSQVHVHSDNDAVKSFTTAHGSALNGKGVQNEVLNCEIPIPEKDMFDGGKRWMLIFARYQGAEQELRDMRPLVIPESRFKNKTTVRVGKMELKDAGGS